MKKVVLFVLLAMVCNIVFASTIPTNLPEYKVIIPSRTDKVRKISDSLLVLEDGEVKADELSFVNEGDLRTVGLEIHSGKNRIVRRIFDALGYHVIKLDRVYFAGLTKKNLPRGKWRYLSEMEVTMLKMSASAFKG